MSIEAALAVANQWLDEVPGVHLVGPSEDDRGEFILVFVDGPTDPYRHQLPAIVEGIRVVVEQSDLAEPHAVEPEQRACGTAGPKPHAEHEEASRD